MASKKTKKRGLGSPNMDEETKHDIQSKGGQASHGGGQEDTMTEEDSAYYDELRMGRNKGGATKEEDAGLAEELDPGMDLSEDWEEDEAA